MKGSLFLGRIAGIKIFIHWTFLILIAWIVGSGIHRGLDFNSILWYLAFIMAIFGCVTLHELGHSLTAKKFNIPTKDITLLPIGGLARFEKLPEEPKKELLIAIAGPVVNFVIAGIVFLFWDKRIFSQEELTVINRANFVFWFMWVNLFIGLFNLIPAFPMDGGRILRAALSLKINRVKATKIASFIGQVLAIGFVFIGFFANPFLILIGIFVYLGARAEAEFVESQSLLKNYYVRDVVMTDFYTLNPQNTIGEATEILLNSQVKDFLILNDDNTVAGSLSRDRLITALSNESKTTPVIYVMDKEITAVEPSMPLNDFFVRVRQQKDKIYPVIDNGKLLGIVDSENIFEFLLVRNAEEKFSNAE